MAFSTYILHCGDGGLYTGTADNLQKHIANIRAGLAEGFTPDQLPVELVWSQQYRSHYDAVEAEKELASLSYRQKLDLIESAEEEDEEALESDATTSAADDGGQIITGTIAARGRLDKMLAEASGLSRERVKALIGEGKVLIGGKPAKSGSAKVAEGTAYSIAQPPAADAAAQPQDIPLDVVFEDEHLIVVNKPAGMVVHPAAGNPDGTLVNALLHHCAGKLSGIGGVARPGIVHRIDKDTSGLLVVAKTTEAHHGLAAQFADHSILRRYMAVCKGHPIPAERRIEGRIGRDPGNRKKMAVLEDDSTRGKHAVSHIRVLERLESCSLIECHLETGRTHQVRVHCASIGHPLLGDQTYGRTKTGMASLLKRIGFTRQALHAADLGFIHPVSGEKIALSAPIPADMQELIDETTR